MEIGPSSLNGEMILHDIISLVQRLRSPDVVFVPFDLFHRSLYRAPRFNAVGPESNISRAPTVPVIVKSPQRSKKLHFRIRLQAETAAAMQPFNLPFLRSLVSKKLLTQDQSDKFQVAFDEALTNAVDHGCLELDSKFRSVILDDGRSEYDDLRAKRLRDSTYGKRFIWITFAVGAKSFRCKIRDSGRGFDQKSVEKVPPGLDIVSGRGLMLIRRFADIVTYNKHNNQIELEKFLKA